MALTPTIGLEIHAELKTRTKMFCACANDPDETRANVNVCPVCLAHPGTLPVANGAAVSHLMRIGSAVGGTLSVASEFDRKSYFYPDIPKGFQISQYERPFVKGGALAGVAITRIHLEEDTARSTHAGGKSLVDFNRAGVPLMELVTEPVIHDAQTAAAFARELQLLLRTLGVGDANLEKGEMRIEANISVSADPNKLGTKVEVKNLNSFRSVERAIAYELDRHARLLEAGMAITQETRGWNESKQETFHQRLKEGSADYRYFPEPDLPKFLRKEITAFSDEMLRTSLPELPDARRKRYAEAYGLKSADAAQLVGSAEFSALFDEVVSHLGQNTEAVRLAANYIITDLAGIYAKHTDLVTKLTANSFASLMQMLSKKEITSRAAKDLLLHLTQHGGDPEVLAKEQGLTQIHDADELLKAVDRVLKEETRAVEEYRGGKSAAIQYLVGKAMKHTKGSGNPEKIKKLFIQKLS